MILAPFRSRLSPWTYLLLAPFFVLVQNLAVWLAFRAGHLPLEADLTFWFLPVRKLIDTGYPGLDPAASPAILLLAFASTVCVGILSFGRASRSGLGFGLAILSIVPGIQPVAVALLCLLPLRRDGPDEPPEDELGEPPGMDAAHVLQGLLAGVGIIVLAVIVSALTFGAYGYGLFLLTPFTVGMATAYLANRRNPLPMRETMGLVLCATALGGLALIAFALEGLMCLIIASPLVVGAASVGGMFGRSLAEMRNDAEKPLMAFALLPAVFALEAAIPPAAAMETRESVDIAAPPAAVWNALVADRTIAEPPGLVGRAGLAYPLRGRLVGRGVGAERLGYFSTGTAREKVTVWQPGRALAFRLLSQPPAMEEMSPYRRVHAPHVIGYFDTGETRFSLQPLAGGRTRVVLTADHVLRLDPIPYWLPIARWAAGQNSRRVLADLKKSVERPA